MLEVKGTGVALVALADIPKLAGTASCSVTIADAEIGSPLIQEPTVLVAMNGPSVEPFGKDIAKGGTLIYNASMVPETPILPGVRVVPIVANAIATRSCRTW